MIVYGDQTRVASSDDTFASLSRRLKAVGEPPIEIHGQLVAALIEAGQLAQAIADSDAATAGHDGASAAGRRLMSLTLLIAETVGRSWWTDGLIAGRGLGGEAPVMLDEASAACAGYGRVVLREPEGYSCYAVYPEAYWGAALAWGGGPEARVIGIRSIGTSLSAMVAAAVQAPAPATVRPIGHPFRRTLRTCFLASEALAGSTGDIAIVDEGPGLSGSSFGAVADQLGEQGIGPDRIVFFPSHASDPGPQATPHHLALWRSSRRHLLTFDDLALTPLRPAHRLDAWFVDLTGPALAPLEDLAAGRWRALQTRDETAWPPADAATERRKFLLHARAGDFLLKFSGLGRSGMERFAMRRSLADAGFTMSPTAWRHGFTIEPWRADLTPLGLTEVDRGALVERLGTYLGFRASRLPAEGRSGASPATLLDMAIVNTTDALGPDAGRAVERWRPGLDGLTAAVRPVVTDNRLHRWEWLVSADGTLLKTDVVDHHAGHDLIGCQDIAWDLAGAWIEFDLSSAELASVATSVEGTCGRPIDPDLLEFSRLAYLGFWLGASHLAAERSQDADQRRWSRAMDRYRRALRAVLS